jgi:amidase
MVEICFKTATELRRLLADREVSAKEVVEAHLEQIARVNPKVNAICTLVADRALREATEADEKAAGGSSLPQLHGLPVAVKDLVETRGIRTTFGSRIYRDFVPDRDDLIVERLKAAGAVIVGKTNTPEFGAGSQTFNEVFGETKNPYDTGKTCGGSSGGGAVALACGMVPIADGSDLGGSLRNPPSFCNVVGFRPSPGRVPRWPTQLPWQTLSVLGPMARTVEDAALLLSALAGPDSRSPISLEQPGSVFAGSLKREFKGTRIAWTADLGRYPVQPEVVSVCRRALSTFSDLGCVVDEAHPDFSDADEVFQTLRAWMFAFSHGEELKKHRHLMKDTVIWNTEQGLSLTGLDIARAQAKRGELYQRVTEFMDRYEFLILPVSQVAPFPIEVRWVREINGIRMKTYIDWMATCYAITLTSLPAISVPCGFTPDGLPIGLQIVGRRRRDLDVLQLAYAFEQATKFGEKRPEIAV